MRGIRIGLFVTVCLFFCSCGEREGGTERIYEQALVLEEAEEAPIEDREESLEYLYVHVCGAVNVPGVYEFMPGTRYYEAVERAGGFSEEADRDQVNLAQELNDGLRLYIPAKGEQLSQQESQETSQRININTASEEQLLTLPGIGQSRARSIIAYREAHGGFQSVEEIQQIEGIKEKVYSKLKDYITIK